MLDDRGFNEFYHRTVQRLLREGTLSTDDSILVVCGGPSDKTVLHDLGFKRVTISNVDSRMHGSMYAPFDWSYQDAENLSAADESYDVCLVHSGLHHCGSPHRAILEMYRVARRLVILFEPYDNVVTRIGVAMNMSQEYEMVAVEYNQRVAGGLRNSCVPNYVYRFTRRDIEKTIACAAPEARPRLKFVHRMAIPWGQLKSRRNKLYLLAGFCAWPVLKVMTALFPTLCPGFAAIILKPDLKKDLMPWLKLNEAGEAVPDHAWFDARFKTNQGR